MRTLTIRMLALAALLAGVVPSQVFAQATALPGQEPAPPPAPQAPGQATGATFCGVSVPPPANLPPDNSGPVVWQMGPCFSAQGNAYTVEPQTYLYYMQLRPSQPSQNLWVPYNEQTEQTIREDFHRLWNTNFLEDLRVEVTDYTFSNGVVGKLVTYHIEERERVKITNYEGSKEIDRTKIEEQLRERGIELRLDSFVDEGVIRRIKTVLREMMAEKGFTNAGVIL